MTQTVKHATFAGRLVIVGFGSIGQGVLPLLLRHIDMEPGRVTIVTAEERGHDEADDYGIAFDRTALTPDNYQAVLSPLLGRGDFLLNLSVDVSSVALIEFARERGALYLDTCIEPWAGGYTDTDVPPSLRSNYALREQALALRSTSPGMPTAVITHGANPGLVSHFVKQAMLDIARDTGRETAAPTDRAGWTKLAMDIDVKAIHIAERDTQRAKTPKEAEVFVNTWSVEGFLSEGMQPAELGWGTHEKWLPENGRLETIGSKAGAYLLQPGANTRVRSWCPTPGAQYGFLVTHNESISIADYFTVRDGDRVVYRPTCHYAYHPANDAVLSLDELFGQAGKMQDEHHILDEHEIVDGIDELGVLLYGHRKNAYWYGSQLSIEETRDLAQYQNATGLQVTSAVLAGMVWALENPQAGIVEADEMDFRRCLEVQRPYLGPVKGYYTDWTPLTDRPGFFPEDIDPSDPWQFRNVLVR
ncbi:MAG TPA: saccharopine dehydrogenase C-terminal domain-containing protein [Arenibaculum sp.]|nr:saccharopine dehydrogenase C-terminal domain-containing protein [Arenibaculum sp.]